jgi:hypothetical protein
MLDMVLPKLDKRATDARMRQLRTNGAGDKGRKRRKMKREIWSE